MRWRRIRDPAEGGEALRREDAQRTASGSVRRPTDADSGAVEERIAGLPGSRPHVAKIIEPERLSSRED